MKTNMKTILISLILLGLLAVFSHAQIRHAQIRTVKGNYCGNTMGNRAGTFGFRVGSEVLYLDLTFGAERGNAKMVRFNVNKLRVGDEFIIKYDASDEEAQFIKVITGTGKRKQISPCSME